MSAAQTYMLICFQGKLADIRRRDPKVKNESKLGDDRKRRPDDRVPRSSRPLKTIRKSDIRVTVDLTDD